MEIELQVSNIPKDFIDFAQKVSNKEGLNDWKLIIWNIKNEAECIPDMKLIYLPKDDIEKMKTLFLHEVAHAIFKGSEEDSYWHRDEWKKVFDELLNRYLI